ncbi:protein GAST1 [Nicotiana tabacum]|uniref:Protein GAST1 n=1 Tax=Nicotiana tabacum TaxID=4097 RepID=A0A1S3XJA2_TOBAC|nr:protein GAST1-like [Nicotiana tomentosiformis]XP_016439996.1 PREDICTED: protein GAST1-like [Nicotiana tabacum]
MAGKLSIVLFVLLVVFFAQNQVSRAKLVLDSKLQTQRNYQMYGVSQGSLHPQDCLPKCTYRCSQTSFKKPCMFFCQKCCSKCLCVPPGTYGNKQTCPCYNNWKTKEGGPKCP